MKWQVALLAFLAFTSQALGHFVYILPPTDKQDIQVVFSDSLGQDEKVAIDKIAATELIVVDATGKQANLIWTKAEHCLKATLPASAPVLVGGITRYGVANSRHTGNIPVLLKYYPKAVIGEPAAALELRLAPTVPFEIVPLVRDGKLQFVALRDGKPLPDCVCVVQVPGEPKREQLQTEFDGQVPGTYSKPGRYGVWVKLVDATPGEWEGQRYEKVNCYATLVVEFAPSAQ